MKVQASSARTHFCLSGKCSATSMLHSRSNDASGKGSESASATWKDVRYDIPHLPTPQHNHQPGITRSLAPVAGGRGQDVRLEMAQWRGAGGGRRR